MPHESLKKRGPGGEGAGRKVNPWVDPQEKEPRWTKPGSKKKVVEEREKRDEGRHEVTRVTNCVPKFKTVSHKGAKGGGPKIM